MLRYVAIQGSIASGLLGNRNSMQHMGSIWGGGVSFAVSKRVQGRRGADSPVTPTSERQIRQTPGLLPYVEWGKGRGMGEAARHLGISFHP